jgi:hypothetical protein
MVLRVPTHTHFQPFAQALFGGVHGFNSYFPVPVGKVPTSYERRMPWPSAVDSMWLSQDISGYAP